MQQLGIWHPTYPMEVVPMWTPGSRTLTLEIKKSASKDYSRGDYVPFDDKVLMVEKVEESEFSGYLTVSFGEPDIEPELQDGPPLPASQNEWMESINTRMAALENRLDSLIKIIRKEL